VIASVAGAWVAVFDVGYWLHQFQTDSTRNDFVFYYVGAEIGVRDGWSRLYDVDLQDALYSALRGGTRVAENLHYVNPPPLAWIVTPFTLLTAQDAFVGWTSVNLAAFALTWWLLAPGGGIVKAAHLLAPAAFFPLVWSFINGEVVLLVAVLIAGAAVLLRARKEVAAGLLLGLALALKPTLAFVIPATIFAAGYWRAAATSAVFAGALGLISLAMLGTGGVAEFRHLASLAQDDPRSYSTTIRLVVGTGPAALVAEALLVIAAVFAALRMRGRDPGLAVAVGILGSLLAAPYLHPYDLALLLVAGWLQLRSADGWLLAWLGFGWVAAEIVGAGNYYPIVAFELGWLALLIRNVVSSEPRPDSAASSTVPSPA
jgi:Glycosyltransferase family 87